MRKMFVLSAVLAAGALTVIGMLPANAIVGGAVASDAGPNVGISNSTSSCSGTILSRRWVISASHCFDGDAGTIQWGNVTRAQGQEVTYSKVFKEDDFAMVQLDTLLPEGAVDFPLLGDADPQGGDIVQFSGFGRDDSGVLSPVLRTGSAVVVPVSWNDAFGGPAWRAKNNGHGLPVPGDSGSGAYLDGKLVGVSSTITGSNLANFASVAAHRSFIDSTIAEQSMVDVIFEVSNSGPFVGKGCAIPQPSGKEFCVGDISQGQSQSRRFAVAPDTRVLVHGWAAGGFEKWGEFNASATVGEFTQKVCYKLHGTVRVGFGMKKVTCNT